MDQEGSIQPVQESVVLKKPWKSQNRHKSNQLLYYYFSIKDFKSAQELIDKLINEYGETHEYANKIQGFIFKMTGQLQKSIETFKKSLSINDQDYEVLKTISKNLQLSGRFKVSLELSQKALKLQPNDWEIFYTMGNCYFAQRDQDKALISFKRAFELSINECTCNRLAKFYIQQGKNGEAFEVYKKALNEQKENKKIKSALGILLLREERFEEAKNFLQNVETTDVKTLLAMGAVNQEQLNFDDALNYYRKILVINPTSAQVWNNVAMCFFGKQQYLQSIISLKRAIYQDPFEPIIHYNMGLIHLNQKQYMSAYHCFQTAISLNPEDSQAYMYLGIALNKLNDFQNCCRSFERAIELDKEKDYLIYLNFCLALFQHGDDSAQYAQKIYEQFNEAYQLFNQQNYNDSRCSKEDVADLHLYLTRYFRN